MSVLHRVMLVCACLSATVMGAQQSDTAAIRRARECPQCAAWNEPQKPFKLYGNVYYVGTHGLASILITSPRGHILIDGGLPESAAPIIANIRALGFIVEDVRLLINSHAHYDHAGGLAELQRATGAEVAASEPSARELRRGSAEPDDPQYGITPLITYPAVSRIRVIRDGETLRVNDLSVTAHFTPGHTPGGTTWSFRACENGACKDFVYADSQTAVSSDSFLFTNNTSYPGALADFAHGLNVIEHLPCDVLLTPHPGISMLFERIARRDAGDVNALEVPNACARFAATARENIAKRVAAEKK